MIRVEGLFHRYTKNWVINDVSFNIDTHGVVGLIGSNGAGKSTCMGIICGVLYPTAGDVLVDGISMRKDPIRAKRQIGFLPQQVPIHPELTVDEYLFHCARLRGLTPNETPRLMDETKSKCGINEYSKRLIGALSGGYKQRVGIAQAILHDPSVIVLDEPTNGLDPNQIISVRRLINEIARDRTVLLSTHVLSEVAATCREIKMIERGEIVFDGSIEEFEGVTRATALTVTFGDPPSIAELERIPNITDVDQVAQNKLRVVFSGEISVAEKIVDQSVKRGWRLQQLILENSTLEDVFAKLSHKQSTLLPPS